MTNRIRNASAALLFLVCLVALTSAFNLPNKSPDLSRRLASLSMAAKPAQQRTMLTLADRIAYQRAIEEVYWRHRIWPKERPDPKPSLDQVMPFAQLEKKVGDYLRNSEVLEDYWHQPLSAEQLQAEMERMAQHTKQPEVLRELFEALGNDPFVIAECLARPALSARLVTNFYAHDQRFHGQLRQRAEAELRAHHTVRQMKQTSGKYSEIKLVKSDGTQDADNRGAEPGLNMNSGEWDDNVQKLAAMFHIVTKWSITFSLPIFWISTLFSVSLLGISGGQFIPAWPLVVAFSIGSMINVGTGAVGYILLMTGHTKISFLNSLTAVVVDIILGIILTPRYGAMGVATLAQFTQSDK